MDCHGIDCDRHAWIEELIDRLAIFGFEGDLAKSVSGAVSSGFCVKKDQHVVTGPTL
jgi:hypothetical protein